jgi:hypothetical protein
MEFPAQAFAFEFDLPERANPTRPPPSPGLARQLPFGP